MKRVEIRIKGTKQTLKTEGFAGNECLTTTEGLRARLAGEVISEEATSEMYDTQDQLESA